MINKLLYHITAKLPCHLINLKSGPYLERYYIGYFLGVTFYLHRFIGKDNERHIHNHPWTHGFAIVLLGSYIEERAVDICPTASDSGCLTEYRRIRWFNRINGNVFHRIHDTAPGTWTLFAHGKRPIDKGWGFLSRKYVVGHHEVTMFKPYSSLNKKWWKTAALGRDAGRIAL